jgi:hypothetical protein
MRWFDRQFVFNFPVSLFPSVLERVRGTPARLEDRLESLIPAVLTKRNGEEWSIQEHAGHLLDLEPLGMQRLDDYEAAREILTATDLENLKTFEANHNGQSIETILNSFRKERLAFVQRLEGYDSAFVERQAMHPRLKTNIRVLDFTYFIAEHDDHHLARISDLIRLFNET